MMTSYRRNLNNASYRITPSPLLQIRREKKKKEINGWLRSHAGCKLKWIDWLALLFGALARINTRGCLNYL